jgi:hypothetical protein
VSGVPGGAGGKGRVHASSTVRKLASFRNSGRGPNWLRFAAPSEAPILASFRNHARADSGSPTSRASSQSGRPPSHHPVQDLPSLVNHLPACHSKIERAPRPAFRAAATETGRSCLERRP